MTPRHRPRHPMGVRLLAWNLCDEVEVIQVMDGLPKPYGVLVVQPRKVRW